MLVLGLMLGLVRMLELMRTSEDADPPDKAADVDDRFQIEPPVQAEREPQLEPDELDLDHRLSRQGSACAGRGCTGLPAARGGRCRPGAVQSVRGAIA